jgi:hypothetical protein
MILSVQYAWKEYQMQFIQKGWTYDETIAFCFIDCEKCVLANMDPKKWNCSSIVFTWNKFLLVQI